MIGTKSLALGAGVLLTLTGCGAATSGPGATNAGCTSLNSTGAAPASSSTLANAASFQHLLPVTAGSATVKIGLAAPLTGDQQAIGVDEQNGAQLAVDEANAKGVTGPDGTKYTFKLDPKDDQHNANQAKVVAQQLVDDGVVAVVGHLNSGASIPASEIYHTNGVAQVSPSATNPKLTHQGFTNVFRVVGQDGAQGKDDADWLVKTLGCKNIGIIDDKTAYGQGLADFVNDSVKSAGGNVVGREHGTDKDTDFNAQITSLKGKSPAPDAIFFGGIYPQAGPIADQMKKQGLSIPLMGGDGIHSSKFLDLAGDAKNGNFATDAGPDNTLIPGFTDFNARYKAKYNQDVVQYAPEAYDAANIIINSIATAGTDKAAIVKAIAATKDYKGITQTYTFDSNGDILNAVFTVYKVVDGKWKALKTVT
jgi:branched-chain amino acid transport system substrate-binding protein